MCCFSRPIESVSRTRIFARRLPDHQMAVVYSMQIVAAEDLAMVLPLPVQDPDSPGALTFVDLSGYKDFFKDMERGFPKPVARSMTKGMLMSYSADLSATLPVEQVGAFEASFVPHASDFGRLDERFRLPPDAVAKLPGAKDMSFAVFRLAAGEADIHPMAFTYRAARHEAVLFPTLHVHDGEVHPTADFDHALYCQSPLGDDYPPRPWERSAWPADRFMTTVSQASKAERGDSHGISDKTCGLVDPHTFVHKRSLVGLLPNIDVAV